MKTQRYSNISKCYHMDGTLAISVICQPGMASTSSFVNTSSFAFASGAADGWRRRCGVRPDPVRGVDGVRGSRLESTRVQAKVRIAFLHQGKEGNGSSSGIG